MNFRLWIITFLLWIGLIQPLDANPSDLIMIAVGKIIEHSETPQMVPGEKGSCIVSVLIFNRGDRDITLPTNGIGPHTVIREGVVEVVFSYIPEMMSTKGGPVTIIPSMNRFSPVVIKRGEGLALDNMTAIIRRNSIEGRKVIVSYKTSGFLSDRMKFSSVDLREQVEILESRQRLSDILESRWSP